MNSFMFQVTILLLLLSSCTNAADSITQSQTVSEGRTLVSAGGSFELGFFSQVVPTTVTWEYGTRISQLQQLFG